MVKGNKGRIPTKERKSVFGVRLDELKFACGTQEPKTPPKEFNPKAIENMRKNIVSNMGEGMDMNGSENGMKDTRKGSLFENDGPASVVSIDDFTIGVDHFDDEDGRAIFASKGITMVGADLINAKRLMMLCVIAGMKDGITANELAVTMHYPYRVIAPIAREVAKPVDDFSAAGMVSLDGELITCTETGHERIKGLIACLSPREKDLLHAGAKRRIAVLMRERAAGRGYSPVPKIDNTKPAYDRIDDVMKLAEYLMDKDIKAGGVVKEIKKE